jgi:hypothetical protein
VSSLVDFSQGVQVDDLTSSKSDFAWSGEGTSKKDYKRVTAVTFWGIPDGDEILKKEMTKFVEWYFDSMDSVEYCLVGTNAIIVKAGDNEISYQNSNKGAFWRINEGDRIRNLNTLKRKIK